MRLIVDTYSVLGQFLHMKDEEYGLDITFEGDKYHIPSIETCKERVEEYLQGVLNRLEISPQNVIMVCDPPETGAGRKRKFPFYKSKRSKRPKQYYDVFNELVEFACELVMKAGGLTATPRVVPAAEGDDLVYELVKRLPQTTILSVDKDMLAFPATHHFIGGEMDPYKFPVPQDLIVLYRTIVEGDTSDSIPSCKGFGPKAWEKMLALIGPEGVYGLKTLVEEKRLEELKDDVLHFAPFQLIIDQAEQIYASYECMSPTHIPAHKIKWQARCQECSKELVTQKNFTRVYAEVAKLIKESTHSVIDFETDVPPESLPWLAQTKNDDGKGGIGVDVIASEITGMGLKLEDKTWYFSVDHKDTDNISLEDLESIIKLIENKRTYAHNSTGFENVVLYNSFGRMMEEMLDTFIMASYVNENDFMGLKYLSKRDLDYDQTSYDQVLNGRAGMREVTGEEVLEYGIDDVITCDALQNLYTTIMQYEGSYEAFLEIEKDSAFVTSLAFAEGVGFDAEEHRVQREANNENIIRAEAELDSMLIELGFGEDAVYRPLPDLLIKSSVVKLAEAVTGGKVETSARSVKGCVEWMRERQDIYEKVIEAVESGIEAMNELYRKHWVPRANLNVRSPTQVKELLYGTLQCPVRIRNKVTDIQRKKAQAAGVKAVGSPATNEEAINNAIAFNDTDEKGIAALKKLVEYKGYLTKESLFFSKYPKFVHWKTGRIHCNMKQCGATTRRFTHTPNLAQLPKKKGKEVRNMVVALEGYELLANDFDSQELKLQAEDCKCKEFLSCYIGDNKKDVHCMTGFQVAIMQGAEVNTYEEFESHKEDSTKPFRTAGKGTNFSTSYLCQAERLAHMLAVTVSTAQSFIDAKDKAFPGLMPYIEKYIAICRKRKYSVTFMGARRHLAKMYAMARSDFETSKVDRLAWSFRIQSSGAEQIKMAMGRAWRAGIYKDKKVLPVTIIHDEFVNQVRTECKKEMIPIIHARVVDNYANMIIPAGSTPEVGVKFGSLKKWDLARGCLKEAPIEEDELEMDLELLEED